MKVKLYVHLFASEIAVYASNMIEYFPLIKEVSVNVPDDMLPDEKEQKRLKHSWAIGKAQKDINLKQDELAAAEEVLKNLLAIEYQPESEL